MSNVQHTVSELIEAVGATYKAIDIRSVAMPTARTLQGQEMMPESKNLCLKNGAGSETISQRKQ